MRNASSTLKISIMTYLSVVLAIHSLLISASARTESSGPAYKHTHLQFWVKLYCTGSPQSPATLGIHLHAVTQGGTVKDQWQIIGSEFGDIMGTITG